jgi:hypothetical protein
MRSAPDPQASRRAALNSFAPPVNSNATKELNLRAISRMEFQMIVKTLTAALAGALLATTAVAQTSTEQRNQSSPSVSTGAPAQLSANQWQASDLDGLDVYNNDEKIGDISELIVDKSGKISAVIIGVGGFLGMGQHDVAIPFDQVRFQMEPRNRDSASANTNTNQRRDEAAGMQPNNNARPNNNATTGTSERNASRDANRARRANAPDHAVVNMTKDQLKAAPKFDADRNASR